MVIHLYQITTIEGAVTQEWPGSAVENFQPIIFDHYKMFNLKVLFVPKASTSECIFIWQKS